MGKDRDNGCDPPASFGFRSLITPLVGIKLVMGSFSQYLKGQVCDGPFSEWGYRSQVKFLCGPP